MLEGKPAPEGDIQVRLLGPPGWRRLAADGTLHGGPLAARDAALLALLAVDGAVARDRVAAWLWPEAESQARANLSLRQRLFRLRRECGHALVDAGQSLSLCAGVHVDLHTHPIPTEGVFLAGLDFGVYEAFDDWARAARDAIGRRQADVLAGEAAALESEGRLAQAIALCERIVAHWPATEHAWRRLIRLHWRRADRAAAIASFERFEQQVCREWGLRPSAETLALLAQVEGSDAASANPAAAAPAAALPPGLVHPPHLVGRSDTLAAWAAAWQAGRAVLILAPGGMGKSRLLEAAPEALGLPPRDAAEGLLRVRARPGDADRPYATAARALEPILARHVGALAPAVQAELARLLPQLGPAPAAPADPSRLWSTVAGVLQAARQRGLRALLWDDLHWADTGSLALLRALLSEPVLAGLPQAFAARPDEDTPAASALADWLGDSLRVQPLRLAPWGAADIQALLPTLGLPPALAARSDLAAELQRQTGGQPFFVLETLKALVLAGPAALPPGPAPSVSAIVDRRVMRLPPAPRRLLQLLAVAGEALPMATAAAVLQRPLVDLADDWAALAAALLVADDGVAHDLVRQAILAGLPAPARQALQLALARVWSQRPGTDPARLGTLWAAGEAWPEAAEAWRAAGVAAAGTGQLAEAEALFERALAAARRSADVPLQLRVLEAAMPTRLLRHGPEAAVADLQGLQPDAADRQACVRRLLLIGEAEMSRMRPAEAHAAAAEAMALGDESALDEADFDERLLVDTTLLYGRTLAWTGQAGTGVRLLQAACERADGQADLRTRLRVRSTLADVLVADGQRGASVAVQRENLVLAQRLGDRFERAVTASNLALYELLIGDAQGCLAAADQALQDFEAMGVAHVNRPMCAAVFGMAAGHAGRFDRALQALAPLLGRPGDPLTDPVRRNVANVRATLALYLGDADEARAWLPPLDEDLPLTLRVSSLAVRLRWRDWTGTDAAAERSRMAALFAEHAALRDDPLYYRHWAPWDGDPGAVARLDHMARHDRAAGAPGSARALELMALQIRARAEGLARGTPRAVARRTRVSADTARRGMALAAELPLGLHPALLPSEAHWAVAQVLDAAGREDDADRLCKAALTWVDAARLPVAADEAGAGPAAQRWRTAHPVHGLLQASR